MGPRPSPVVWCAAVLFLAACSAPPPVVETTNGEDGSEGVGPAAEAYAEQIAQIDDAMMAHVRDGSIAASPSPSSITVSPLQFGDTVGPTWNSAPRHLSTPSTRSDP